MKKRSPLFLPFISLLINIAAVQADESVIASTNSATGATNVASADAISSHAATDVFTLSNLTPSNYAQLNTSQQKTIADMWHLTADDMARYLWLMSNTPDAFYYSDKHLDPSWILGFEANNEQERQKYVIIAIQNERARIEKELAFQRDFTQLQQQLFPNQKPVNWTDDEMTSAKPIVIKK